MLEIIAKCFAQHNYSPVHIPTAADEETKEFLRMRDDHKLAPLRRSNSRSLRFAFATTIAMMEIVTGQQHISNGLSH